jgi:hypothetical protein
VCEKGAGASARSWEKEKEEEEKEEKEEEEKKKAAAAAEEEEEEEEGGDLMTQRSDQESQLLQSRRVGHERGARHAGRDGRKPRAGGGGEEETVGDAERRKSTWGSRVEGRGSRVEGRG